jgi:ATP-dependent exoDNAse (exonuclease V) beta subunit
VRAPREGLPDAGARRRIREDLATTLFVEAAAGTGKTTELVGRIVALLRAGAARLDRIVAVTFTEKAAGEMKLRLREEIERARAGAAAGEAARLAEAIEQLELAHIATIHGFCAELLRERPVEAGVDPLFEVAPEDASERLLDQAFDAWFQVALADPPEGVRRVLRRRPRGPDAGGPRESLRAAAGALVEHRDFPAPWRREPFGRDAELDRVMEELAEVGALACRADREDDYLARHLAEVAAFVEETRHLEAVRGRDHDGLEAGLRDLARSRSVHWHWRGSPRRAYAADLPREEVLARRDAAKSRLDALLAACDADLAALLREELRPVVAGYEALKRKAGRLDFLDLLVRARDLVRGDAGVRRELQRRFTHFFVDEFQDTDPLQAELLVLLAADDPSVASWLDARTVPGKLFLVGDPKQSIYRFRRADVMVYERTKRLLVSGGAALVHLTTSFRAVPSLQAAVNAAFAPRIRATPDGSQADYVALSPWRAEQGGRPALVALPVPRPYGDFGRITDFAIERSLPDAVGAFVDWLVRRSGWCVTERGAPAPVPVAARHVCILFRRFRHFRSDVTRSYVRALEARGLPHVLVGGRSFHAREEVLAIRNALCAVEWPEDELRVFATLRGPLFALGDDALLAFRAGLGRLHPLRRLDPGSLPSPLREVAEALGVLGRLHLGRNRRPLGETIGRLLAAVRAHAGIAIWPTGEQALANVLRTIDLARRFERGGAASFRAFVEHLLEEAQRGEAEDAPAVEQGTEGVRIMTVHRAKGLEFPVVILADPTCKRVRELPTRHVDAERGLFAETLCGCAPQELLEAAELERRRDEEEAARIAYVAATRARDLLVVPVVGDAEREGWLDALNPAVYPRPGARRRAREAPGCPPFGEDSVFERPPEARRDRPTVRPGLHAAPVGEHEVVWWDPRALDLDREETLGLRQQQVLAADAEGVHAAEGEAAHAGWQASRAGALARGGEPSLRVAAVTALAASEAAGAGQPPPAGAAAEAAAPTAPESAEAATAPKSPSAATPIRVEEVAISRAGRPGGLRFGSLVHAVLASVDLDADAAAVRATAAAQGRLLGATPEEVAAAAEAAAAALAHPLLRRAARAAASGDLRRETPVALRLDDGSLAEGVVDLAFREETDGAADPRAGRAAAWTVVDFKTDRELAARRAEYERQVALYARAVARATGEPAEGVLLVT